MSLNQAPDELRGATVMTADTEDSPAACADWQTPEEAEEAARDGIGFASMEPTSSDEVPGTVPLLAPARRLLAFLPGSQSTGLPVPVLAAYADVSSASALRHLSHLVRIGLAERGGGDDRRFRGAPSPASIRTQSPGDAGYGRATTWYLGCAFEAARVLGAAALPGNEQLRPDPLRPPSTPVDRHGALEWFAAERVRLTFVLERACALRDDAQAWRLAVLMLNVGCFTGPWDGWAEVCGHGMEAARRDRHRAAQAMIDEYAGKLELTGGDPAAARRCHERSLAIREADGDRVAVARSVNTLGVVRLREGLMPEAEALFEQALALALEADDEEFATFALMNLGAVHARDGRARQAVAELEDAAVRLRAAGREPYVANALADLAVAHFALGDLDRSEEATLEAEQAAVDAGVPMFLPDPLIQHARILIERRHPRLALARLYEARGVYHGLGDEMRAAVVDHQIARLEAGLSGGLPL